MAILWCSKPLPSPGGSKASACTSRLSSFPRTAILRFPMSISSTWTIRPAEKPWTGTPPSPEQCEQHAPPPCPPHRPDEPHLRQAIDELGQRRALLRLEPFRRRLQVVAAHEIRPLGPGHAAQRLRRDS